MEGFLDWSGNIFTIAKALRTWARDSVRSEAGHGLRQDGHGGRV